jgi:quinol monooxygenase YgiN
MIHVLATIELNAGRREEFLAEFHRLMPLVRAEQGCIEYGPAVDLPTGLPAQEPVRPQTVVVIEKWADLPALHAHLQAPHMVEYRGRVKEFVRAVRLQILQPA